MSIICRNLKSILFVRHSSIVRALTMSSALGKEAIDILQKNPYFDKYASKIIEKQKVAPGEFDALWDKLKKEKEQKDKKFAASQTPISPGQAKASIPNTAPVNKSLNDILKLDLVKNEDRDFIEKMWIEHHKTKEFVLAASVPVKTFQRIKEKSKQFPIFLLPLPRDQGYEFIMLQFAENEVHFTPLISYQTHKENAPECFAITYYPDLMEEKNLVLMRGEYDKNVINAMEAQCLANQIQLFYGEENEKRTRLMERFTYHPDEFHHMDLIAELDTLSL